MLHVHVISVSGLFSSTLFLLYISLLCAVLLALNFLMIYLLKLTRLGLLENWPFHWREVSFQTFAAWLSCESMFPHYHVQHLPYTETQKHHRLTFLWNLFIVLDNGSWRIITESTIGSSLMISVLRTLLFLWTTFVFICRNNYKRYTRIMQTMPSSGGGKCFFVSSKLNAFPHSGTL